jgi:hypothetical protein
MEHWTKVVFSYDYRNPAQRESMNHVQLIYLGIVSIALTILGCHILFKSIKYWTQGIKTTGTVVDRGSTMDNNIVNYYSIVEFETADGETIQCPGQNGSSSPGSVTIGKKVTIYYLPDQPEKALVWSLRNVVVPPVAIFLLAGVALFAAFHPRR